jgi:threonine/homoserine efflux transporter RhtA
MSLKKVFIWFSVVPVAISLSNYFFADYGRFTWGYDHSNEIGWVALTIAGINCLYILYRNYKSEKSFGWYVFATFMAIVFFGYLWFAYQLSHAGF